MPTYYRNGSLYIEIRPRETNHPMPHVHACYDGKSVSMALDGTILEGRIRNDKQNEARKWVIDHAEMLEKEWRRIHNV